MVNIEENSTEQPVKRSYKTLWIMIALFALPYAAAMYVYFNRDDLSLGPQSNNGTVISPARPMNDAILALTDGNTMRFSDEGIKGKWLLLTVSSASCEQACMDNMYKMRQLRKAAAEDSLRLQRIFMLTDEQNLDALPQKLNDYLCMHTQLHDTECLKIIRPNDASTSVQAILQTEGHNLNDGIYLIDPLSQYMMFYPADADPKMMLKDIQRLLKVSRIG